MSKKNKRLMSDIKDMENKAREKSLEKARTETSSDDKERVEFDVWHNARTKSIPGHHMKEIIKADFKGRGLRDRETMATYDEALGKYGIKLA